MISPEMRQIISTLEDAHNRLEFIGTAFKEARIAQAGIDRAIDQLRATLPEED